ncbi:MAG: glutamate 5-kinase [Prolixibacteraceae bacterium]|nr:glutamate 5-kinase [Prolixibacteraceae bacterium]MBN2773781.1 glutamate 5-kinase [Prolixibacteraceae bacterium]
MEFRYKRITVKIGSNVLTKKDGTLDVSRIAHLVDQIAFLRKNRVEVIVVSSGAVAAGKTVLNSLKKADPVSSRQLWSALGQVKLINRYTDFFNEHGIACAQVLTTKENFSSRAHYLNMKNCLHTLLENSVVPIINENDTISITELMFTDNDELSGLIASMENSEALIILTNVDGIYNGKPGTEGVYLIPEISNNGFDPEIGFSNETSGFGRGGMITKFRIARKVAKGGIAVHIANGATENILVDVLDRSKKVKQTYFVPEEKSTSGVKRWIAYSDSFAKSKLIINEGACKALISNKAVSLLPIGVVNVEGTFKKGDLVKIYSEKNEFIGVGKARYNSDKIETEKQEEKQKPIIHYDYLYLEDIKINSGFK